MGLADIVRKITGKNDEESSFPVPVSNGLIVREREPEPDELALGFAFGEEDWQEIKQEKFMLQEDRLAHFYVVGGTRTGKTKFLENIALQDMKNGEGFGVIDAHGDLTEDLKGYLYLLKADEPEFLEKEVVLIDPTDKENTVCFNPLEITEGADADLLAEQLVSAFKKIWADAWGERMHSILTNALIALIENGQTLAEVDLILTNAAVRQKLTKNLKNEGCREFFQKFNSWPKNTQVQWTESTLNKVSQFLTNTKVRQLFISAKSTFDLREIIDGRKILLVKLEKGRLGMSGELLGSLLLSKITAAAFARTDTPESERINFYLYIDEFQNFATDNFNQILSEAGKYRLPLTLAHQYLSQLPNSLRSAILSNCGIQTYFRISREDSNILSREALVPIYQDAPGSEAYVQVLQELPYRCCFIKNRIRSGVVAVRTLDLDPPFEKAGMNEREFAEEVRRANIGGAYLKRRADVEKEYQARRQTLSTAYEPENFRTKKSI